MNEYVNYEVIPSTCQKCRHLGCRTPSFRPTGSIGPDFLARMEHLVWPCERCGHQLITTPADATPNPERRLATDSD